MDYKEIKQLMDDMGESKLDSLEIEFPEGIKISMTKNSKQQIIMPRYNEDVFQKEICKEECKDDKCNGSLVEENLKIVRSPMVGTYYSSPSPDESAFVRVGQKVHKGEVLCIVEAMKLMNEIESEFDGEIVEICVNNNDIVEYGMPLFKIK